MFRSIAKVQNNNKYYSENKYNYNYSVNKDTIYGFTTTIRFKIFMYNINAYHT